MQVLDEKAKTLHFPPFQGGGDLHFLGLAQGHWEIDPRNRNNVYISSASEESINLGIALIVPAYIIKEVLFQDVLIRHRKEREEIHRQRLGTSVADGFDVESDMR